MRKYYFTFDGSSEQPYKSSDYIVVFSEDAGQALKMFDKKYSPVNGFTRWASVYTEDEWNEAGKSFPFPPVEVINRPEPEDILRGLAENLIDDCKAFTLDSISLQVKPNGQVLAVAEYKDQDGKQTFTRVNRRDQSKPFTIM